MPQELHTSARDRAFTTMMDPRQLWVDSCIEVIIWESQRIYQGENDSRDVSSYINYNRLTIVNRLVDRTIHHQQILESWLCEKNSCLLTGC
jgi:hypothetical protein